LIFSFGISESWRIKCSRQDDGEAILLPVLAIPDALLQTTAQFNKKPNFFEARNDNSATHGREDR